MAPQEKTGYAQFEKQYNTEPNNWTAGAEIWPSFIELRLF